MVLSDGHPRVPKSLSGAPRQKVPSQFNSSMARTEMMAQSGKFPMATINMIALLKDRAGDELKLFWHHRRSNGGAASIRVSGYLGGNGFEAQLYYRVQLRCLK